MPRFSCAITRRLGTQLKVLGGPPAVRPLNGTNLSTGSLFSAFANKSPPASIAGQQAARIHTAVVADRYYPNIAQTQNSRLVNPNTVENPILTATAPTHRFHVFIHHPLPPWLYPPKLNDVNVSSHLELVDRDPLAGNLRKRVTSEPEIDVKKIPMTQVLRAENASRLLRGIQLRVARIGGIVNFVYNEDQETRDDKDDVDGFHITVFGVLHPMSTSGGAFGVDHLGKVANTRAPRCVRLNFPCIHATQEHEIDCLVETIQSRLRLVMTSRDVNLRHEGDIKTVFSAHSTPPGESETVPNFILVCTHAARDCRCGTTGRDVAETLSKELQSREASSRWKVFEIGHVGGHKYVQSYA